MWNYINKFFLSQSFLYVIDLLSGRENIVTYNEVMQFSSGVTNVSESGLSEILEVISLTKA